MFELAQVAIRSVGLSAAAALVIYLAAVSIGRWLKRRRGVQLGLFYQLLCVVLAIYLPLITLGIDVTWGSLAAQRDLQAALIILSSIFIVALLNRFLWEQYFEQKRHADVPKFLRDLCAMVIVVAAILIVVGFVYDVKIPGLLAGSGILAIILGFALQDLLGNVFSGIALEIGRPFRPGDWLFLDDQHGQVIDVNWRSVRLRTNDDICLDIPNNQIVRNTIVNLTYPTRHYAMRLMVGIDYGAPPNLVKDILVHAAQDAPGVLRNPPPKAYLKEFGDSSIGYQIKFYMDDHLQYNTAVDAVQTNVWYELKRAGIRIPFPIRTVQIERPQAEVRTRDQAVQALRAQSLFTALDDEQIRRLVHAAPQDRYGRREKIITQGSQGDSMFILVNGRAEVYVDTGNDTQALVASFSPGDCFGEMSLLTGERRSATVVAVTDCDVLEIAKEHLAQLLEEKPEMLDAFGELLARRRMETEGILASASGEPENVNRRRQYCASFLAKLSTYFGL